MYSQSHELKIIIIISKHTGGAVIALLSFIHFHHVIII